MEYISFTIEPEFTSSTPARQWLGRFGDGREYTPSQIDLDARDLYLLQHEHYLTQRPAKFVAFPYDPKKSFDENKATIIEQNPDLDLKDPQIDAWYSIMKEKTLLKITKKFDYLVSASLSPQNSLKGSWKSMIVLTVRDYMPHDNSTCLTTVEVNHDHTIGKSHDLASFYIFFEVSFPEHKFPELCAKITSKVQCIEARRIENFVVSENFKEGIEVCSGRVIADVDLNFKDQFCDTTTTAEKTNLRVSDFFFEECTLRRTSKCLYKSLGGSKSEVSIAHFHKALSNLRVFPKRCGNQGERLFAFVRNNKGNLYRILAHQNYAGEISILCIDFEDSGTLPKSHPTLHGV
jgi:hypothetical protein